ncbi:cytochrome c oxidase subunit II [Trinickia mobilis]|uniref:cytochrome c oxidase subunit II n=1 Tax=Trinickia mobilis TaxID=2816356 RepID=UPI001F5D9375|nr:cytochrome c oxidase subunit II [Trinickia mobilis]
MNLISSEEAFEDAFHRAAQQHERAWVFIVLAMLAVLLVGTMFFVVLDYGLVSRGTSFLRRPDAVMDDPAFREGKVVQTGSNSYAVYMVGHAWAWSPGVVHVKEGAQVTFYVTSTDVLHGFELQGTTINVTAMPGAVGKVEYKFDRAGTYYIICNEYCGIEHHSMIGRIIVDPKDKS